MNRYVLYASYVAVFAVGVVAGTAWPPTSPPRTAELEALVTDMQRENDELAAELRR